MKLYRVEYTLAGELHWSVHRTPKAATDAAYAAPWNAHGVRVVPVSDADAYVGGVQG